MTGSRCEKSVVTRHWLPRGADPVPLLVAAFWILFLAAGLAYVVLR